MTDELNLPPAQRILRDVFGFERFHGNQTEIVSHLCSGGDALVLMPTGGGKSLCYQIPALVRQGVGVVISPLIALMHDQVEALRQLGIRAAFLNSSLNEAEARAVEAQLLAGQLDLLYMAPERLMMPRTLWCLAQSHIALFAIDEAHCVVQWGHDFRPEYIRLSLLCDRFPAVPRVALTATADEETRREIIERLQLGNAREFVSGFDRPNIHYRISEESGDSRKHMLDFILAEHAGESGIVYCLSRKRVESVANWLCAKGLNALPYHAGLPSEQRQDNQSRFVREEGVVMVATIAFGMGIDKPDVRFVAHLNLPRSLEAYYQETGRAGRDGLAADAWMNYRLQDVVILKRMLADSGRSEVRGRLEQHRLDAMLGLCETTGCRRAVLLHHFGDQLNAPCGNCDNCLSPPKIWDATVAAQKALSCVHRTGQRFGAKYVIDVLLGHADHRMRELGHDKLSTFGIGSELDAAGWDLLFRQLIVRGFLTVGLERQGGLLLTEASRPVLRGESRLYLRSMRASGFVQKGTLRPLATDFTEPSDKALWQALRDLRQRLAKAQGVPTYVIFHDATLRQMVEMRPATQAQLGHLTGVGARKLENYGAAFLDLVRSYQEKEAEREVSDFVACGTK